VIRPSAEVERVASVLDLAQLDQGRHRSVRRDDACVDTVATSS
jgi:hypothetical protein